MKFTYDQKKLDAAVKKHDLKFVILHGSYATGSARSDSDLDIAVLGNKEVDFSKLIKLSVDFGKIFGNGREHELDLKTLHRVDPLFRYEVVRSGKLLFGDSLEYEEYKAGAYHSYVDAKPLFQLEHMLAQKYQIHLNNLLRAQ